MMIPRSKALPMLSVIVPTFNAARTVDALLRSLALQSWSDFEVLIQDGKSSDDTIAIVDGFVRRQCGFQLSVTSECDAGIYDAMNRALNRAKGEWVLFLGSDDRLQDADTLLAVSRHLSSDADVVYGDVVAPHLSNRNDHRYAGAFSVSQILAKNICHQSIFVRRELFDRIGKFSLGYRVHADWEHNLRWFLSPDVRVRYVDMVIAVFASGGLSSRGSDFLFEQDRQLLCIKYGRHSLPCRTKLRFLLRAGWRAARRCDIKRFCWAISLWPAVLTCPRVVRG